MRLGTRNRCDQTGGAAVITVDLDPVPATLSPVHERIAPAALLDRYERLPNLTEIHGRLSGRLNELGLLS